MRVIVLSAYPLVDSHPHKILFLQLLLERVAAADIVLCYLRSSIADHLKRARQHFQLRDALQLLRTFRQSTPIDKDVAALIAQLPRGKVTAIAHRWGISVRHFNTTKQLLAFAQHFAPEVIHNFSGVFLPKAILNAAPAGVISGHYGELPYLRGGDTIRWSILLDHPMFVSIQRLAPKLDMGDILLKQKVPVYRSDTFATLRFRCQLYNALGQIAVFDQMQRGTLQPQVQQPSDGSTFYRMGRYLRTLVEQRLQSGQYSHFAEASQ